MNTTKHIVPGVTGTVDNPVAVTHDNALQVFNGVKYTGALVVERSKPITTRLTIGAYLAIQYCNHLRRGGR